MQTHDQYVIERMALPHCSASDFVPVYLSAEPLGAPVNPDGVTELLERLSKRVGPARIVPPHMLRQAAAEAGGGALLADGPHRCA